MEYLVSVSLTWEDTIVVTADDEEQAWQLGEDEGLNRFVSDVHNRFIYPEVYEVEEIAKV